MQWSTLGVSLESFLVFVLVWCVLIFDARAILSNTGNFTGSCSEEARLERKQPGAEWVATAETSSEMMHTVIQFFPSVAKKEEYIIGAKNNCTKDQRNRESGKIVWQEVSSSQQM